MMTESFIEHLTFQLYSSILLFSLFGDRIFLFLLFNQSPSSQNFYAGSGVSARKLWGVLHIGVLYHQFYNELNVAVTVELGYLQPSGHPASNHSEHTPNFLKIIYIPTKIYSSPALKLRLRLNATASVPSTWRVMDDLKKSIKAWENKFKKDHGRPPALLDIELNAEISGWMCVWLCRA